MNLHPSSFWFDGCCFKCTHYSFGDGHTGRICTKHNVRIHGDCGQKCDDYALSPDRWHNERYQRWEWERGLIKPPTQTTLEEYRCPTNT